ncbi:hypothetical protein [Maricaulis sp.]|uniref:hypothetical protein n=1 Tax=Maricaulis sp. TaxID=1486257 RepID=UPI0025C62EFB|nr:hypothetical protein [Maricaulis sp.]
MSDTAFDCVACGACCFSRHPRYLADDPRLAAGRLRWYSHDRGGDAVYDIRESAYCAQPPEGACTRIYNVGVITREDTDAYTLVFEHCWDDAAPGLARCRQAMIDAGF